MSKEDPTLKEIDDMVERVAMELVVFCTHHKVSSFGCEFKLAIGDHSVTHPAVFRFDNKDGAEVQMVKRKKL